LRPSRALFLSSNNVEGDPGAKTSDVDGSLELGTLLGKSSVETVVLASCHGDIGLASISRALEWTLALRDGKILSSVVGWFCWGVWVSSYFWVFRVFFLSSLFFPVLVSFLYTSCMLRGAFTLFINFFAYQKKKIVGSKFYLWGPTSSFW